MTKILIVGATSAIAQETALLYARGGAELFLVGRTPEKLQTVASNLKVQGASRVETFLLDLAELDRHQELVDCALAKLGGLDAVFIAHGTLSDQQALQRSAAETVRDFNLNCTSIISLLTILANYFEEQKKGCIAVISSVAGDRGRKSNYVYGAAKGALNIFLQGLRNRLASSGVTVLTIEPGFVDTPMTAEVKKNFLFAQPAAVGKTIYEAMQKGRDILYVPWFWRYIMFIIKIIPEPIFKRLNL